MIKRHFFDIEMVLAGQVGNSHGDLLHGYHLHLPLTADGYVDASAFLGHADAFRVVRHRRGRPNQNGQILRDAPGSWTFRYSGDDHPTDDTSFRLSEVHLAPGRFVSVTEGDGATRAFKVTSVTQE